MEEWEVILQGWRRSGKLFAKVKEKWEISCKVVKEYSGKKKNRAKTYSALIKTLPFYVWIALLKITFLSSSSLMVLSRSGMTHSLGF